MARRRGSDTSWSEWVYALLLATLPPGPLRDHDRGQMRRTLRDQIESADSGRARWRVRLRALRRLPGVVVWEWVEWLGMRGPARGPSGRRDGDGLMKSSLRNLAFAGRSLRKAPTFAVATTLLVALGVGTVTTVFTVVDHVVLRPLPYPDADRLVYLTNGSHNGPTLGRMDGVEAFDLWTATSAQSVNLTRADGDPLRLRRMETTPSFFTIFGARPLHGRLLVDADRDRIGLAVLTYPFWRDVFGADPAVVGSSMTIDDEPLEIVGVLSETFTPPSRLGDPAHFYRPLDWANPGFERPGYHAHTVMGRLAPGVSLEQANQQIDRVEADVAAAFPDYYDEPQDWPLETLHATTVEGVRGSLLMLLGAVGLLMLVACANVAHLFMARGLSRAREMSIRRALGARTWNLLGQLSAESLVVGLVGGLGGAAFASAGLAFFRRWTADLPRGADIVLDPRVFAVCIGLATLTALLFGLVPALRTVGRDVHEGLRTGGRGMSGGRGIQALRSGLVILEVAMSLVLVASAGLLVRSFVSVTTIDPGMDARGVWMLPLNPTNVESPEAYRTRMEAIRRALLEVPGVTVATYGIEAPFEHVGGDRCCWSGGTPPRDAPDADRVRVFLHPVSEGFFDTFRTELVAGEAWTSASATASPTPVVVSEALANRFYGSAGAALGRELPDLAGGISVVGVAEPTRHYGLDQDHDYAVYLPMEALPFPIEWGTFALRTTEPTDGFARRIREAVWSVEPSLPVPDVATLEDWVTSSSATRRLGSLLFGAFGVVALMLAAAGLYGTLLYTVGQRRQELGIRLALGAGRGRIQGEVIRRGVTHAAVGVTLGVLAAVSVARLLESWLYGIAPTDPVALLASAAVLFVTAVLASWFPAHRAGRTDPLETLHAE